MNDFQDILKFYVEPKSSLYTESKAPVPKEFSGRLEDATKSSHVHDAYTTEMDALMTTFEEAIQSAIQVFNTMHGKHDSFQKGLATDVGKMAGRDARRAAAGPMPSFGAERLTALADRQQKQADMKKKYPVPPPPAANPSGGTV